MTSKLKTYSKQFAIGALIAALGAGTYVIAAVTFTDFTSGSTISSSEMNTKLNALKDAANASAASVTCPADTPTRFTDNNDGTVCDSQTGLMWEIKIGTVGAVVTCITSTDCPDPHDVNNTYTWTLIAAATTCNSPPFPLDCTDPDGTLYTNFLEKLNDLDGTENDGTQTPCFAGHCDWRIPTVGELRSIIEAASPNCALNPCIAAGFPGPTQASFYWSSSTNAGIPGLAWVVGFNFGSVGFDNKSNDRHARAVRGGR